MQQSDSGDPYIDPFNVQETIRAGDTLLYLLNFGIDITGYQFVFTAKRQRTDPDELAVAQTFFTAIAGTQSQAGLLAWEAIGEDLSNTIPPNFNYVFDIRYRTPLNQTATIVDGQILVIQPVSQTVIADTVPQMT